MAEASSRATAGEDAAPELTERLAQEEAAASGALAEAQEQVCLHVLSVHKTHTPVSTIVARILNISQNKRRCTASCLCSFILSKGCE